MKMRKGKSADENVRRHVRPPVEIWMACLLALALVPSTNGQAFRNLDNGAGATAQGAAFAAQADDASAIQYNPAGITQLSGIHLLSGTNLIGATTTFTSPSDQKVSGGSPRTVAIPPPSNFYLTARFLDSRRHWLRDFTAGLGVSVPYGLQVSYPSSGPLSNAATFATLPLLDIKPTVAVKLNDRVSVGGGADIYTFMSLFGGGKAREKLIAGPEFGALGIPTGAPLEANGTGSAVGFNLGGLITASQYATGKPRVNLGLIYRSPVDLDLKGDFLVNGVRVAGAQLQLKLPRIVTGALAIWPKRDDNREFKLEADIDYVDWSAFHNMDLTLSNGAILPFPRDWHKAYAFMFGSEYKWLSVKGLPGWELSARSGYVHVTTPVPDNTFDPFIPAGNNNAFSFGIGLRCREGGSFLGFRCGNGGGEKWRPKAITIDFAYQATIYESKQITTNYDPRVIGRWDSFLHIGAINLGMEF